MKIVNAMFGLGVGGIEQAFVDYADALTLAGHDVQMLIHPKAAIRDVLQKRGMTFHTISNLGAWDIVAVWKLKKLLANLAPDASIAHGNRALGLLACAGAKRLIAPMHNYKIKCSKADRIFCPTQDLMRHAKAQGVKEDHITLIPNMVRLPASKERARHTPPVIGGMGRFVAKKGFDVFIEALAFLKARGIAFKGQLAGDGEEAAALRALARAKDVSDRLTFTGWVENKQAFFDGIDIFCLPSLHEPFGIVLLEAMAQGLPVVASSSEGPSEILNGTNGLLVPKGDATALASALQTLLNSPEQAQALARQAYQTVKNQYDLPVVSAKLSLALHSMI